MASESAFQFVDLISIGASAMDLIGIEYGQAGMPVLLRSLGALPLFH